MTSTKRPTLIVTCLATAMHAFRQGGIAVGVAALGAMIPSATVHLHDAAYVDGLRTALIVCAAVCAVGAIAGFRLIPGRNGVPRAADLGAAVPEAA